MVPVPSTLLIIPVSAVRKEKQERLVLDRPRFACIQKQTRNDRV